MIDATGDDGGFRIQPKTMVHLYATAKAMLDDVDWRGLPAQGPRSVGAASGLAYSSPEAG